MDKRKPIYTAIARADWRGVPPSISGNPPDQREFPDLPSARAWLIEKRCGGSVSFYDESIRDFRSIDVPSGGEA